MLPTAVKQKTDIMAEMMTIHEKLFVFSTNPMYNKTFVYRPLFMDVSFMDWKRRMSDV